jgi:hypothetical protein
VGAAGGGGEVAGGQDLELVPGGTPATHFCALPKLALHVASRCFKTRLSPSHGPGAIYVGGRFGS